jgi:hypothetical protein
MFQGCSKFKVSATKKDVYTKEWRIPKIGTIASVIAGWSTDMLKTTGGTFLNNPSSNTTYYVENDPIE